MKRVKAVQRPRWRLTGVVLGGLTLIILGLSIYRLYTLRIWDGISRFTVVRYTPQAASAFHIVSFDPETNEGIILSVPNSLEIATLGGRGTWRIGVLPELAKRFGWQWAADSLADGLGLATVGLESSLQTWDRLTWWWKTRQMAFRQVDLSETALLEKSDAIDGQKVLGLSTTWDDKARDWFVSARLVREGKTVQIVNTINESGMGTHAAKLIEHSGLRVGNIANDTHAVDRCVVEAEPSETANFLVRQFQCLFHAADGGDIILKIGSAYRFRWLGTK